MKVLIYVRVSTEDQRESGLSIEAQQAKAEAYASLYGHEVVGVHIDGGVSGKTLNRPGIQAALGALEAGLAEGILISKLDRLTRSVRDMGELLETFFSTRFGLLCVDEAIDTSTPAGRLMLNLLTSVAQWEREETACRTKVALAQKKARGEHVGSPALGYQMIDGQLEEVEAELEIIERILEMRQAGKTLQAIADTLNAEGAPTKRGGSWYPCTVSKILKREAA